MTKLALKLVSAEGRTYFKDFKLRPGLKVRRAQTGSLLACSSSAVHVYASLAQARRHDGDHCEYGSRGQVWLVSVVNPRNDADKSIAKTYRVIRYLGRLRWDAKTMKACKRLKLATDKQQQEAR